MNEKKRLYSKLFLLCVAIFIVSLPFGFFIKNNVILSIINIILKLISLGFIIYYSKKEKFEKFEFAKPSKYHLILLPFMLVTFSNLFVAIIDKCSINTKINYLILILDLINISLTAIIEELIFRHYLYKEFITKQTMFKSIIYTSLIFGGMHLLNINSFASIPYCLLQSIYTFGIGLVLSIIYIFSKNIIYPIIFHFLFNFLNDSIIIHIFNIEWNLVFFIVNIIIGLLTGLYGLFVYKRYLCQEVSEYVS